METAAAVGSIVAQLDLGPTHSRNPSLGPNPNPGLARNSNLEG